MSDLIVETPVIVPGTQVPPGSSAGKTGFAASFGSAGNDAELKAQIDVLVSRVTQLEHDLKNARFSGGAVNAPIVLAATSWPSTTMAQLTADQDDWDLPLEGAATFYVDADAARSVTGIIEGIDGTDIWICNTGANIITFEHQDAGSAANNQIFSSSGAGVAVGQDEWIHLHYASNINNWRIK